MNARTSFEKAGSLKFDSKDKKSWYSQQDETPPCAEENIVSAASADAAKLQNEEREKTEKAKRMERSAEEMNAKREEKEAKKEGKLEGNLGELKSAAHRDGAPKVESTCHSPTPANWDII